MIVTSPAIASYFCSSGQDRTMNAIDFIWLWLIDAKKKKRRESERGGGKMRERGFQRPTDKKKDNGALTFRGTCCTRRSYEPEVPSLSM